LSEGPTAAAPPSAPTTTGWRIALVLFLATVAGVVAGFLLSRAPEPPSPPANVTAEPFRCSDPCRSLEASITVRWSVPTQGGEPTGYAVVRDGVPLPNAGQVDVVATSFTDRSVTFGERYEYQVLALGSQGPSPRSAVVSVRLPSPPATNAQLSGEYDVRLTVRDARALSSILGIERPKPDTTGTDRWTFEPQCVAPRSVCPVRWEGLDGRLVPHDRSWTGTVAGPDARCGGGTRVHAPTRFRLETTGALGVDDAWVVGSFRGFVTVSFHCPGFLTSTGSVDVTGNRREPED
jgi:hypothetical protein